MFEDVRRSISQTREARRKERLRKLEVDRRLSYIRTKQLKERRASEEELREQVGTELSARKAARQTLRERQQMERELRGPSPGERARIGTITAGKRLRAAGRTIARTSRTMSKPGVGRKLILGPTDMIFGPQAKASRPTGPEQSVDELIFGKKPEGKSKGLFELDKGILS